MLIHTENNKMRNNCQATWGDPCLLQEGHEGGHIFFERRKEIRRIGERRKGPIHNRYTTTRRCTKQPHYYYRTDRRKKHTRRFTKNAERRVKKADRRTLKIDREFNSYRGV